MGIRIVLYYMDDIAICKEMLKNTYSIIEKDSHEDKPKVNEFNPLRMNYVCRIPEEFIERFPTKLWEDYRIDKTFEIMKYAISIKKRGSSTMIFRESLMEFTQPWRFVTGVW